MHANLSNLIHPLIHCAHLTGAVKERTQTLLWQTLDLRQRNYFEHLQFCFGASTQTGQTQPGQDITRTDTTRTGHNPDRHNPYRT